MEVECKKADVKKNAHIQFDYDRGEIRFFGSRVAFANLIPACDKIDKLFGTGGEVIVSCIGFEAGSQLFETITTNSSNKSRKEVLEEVVDLEPRAGWGITTLKIFSNYPPNIEVTVKNPPVKTLKGSSKHLIGSFWTGVLSKYFDQQLRCARFFYNQKEDKLRCIITA